MYLKRGANCFWVAEETLDPEHRGPGWGVARREIVGCVGLKECGKRNDSMELVRMASSKTRRGQGVGSLLMERLLSHVENTPNMCRVYLYTGNPISARFYQKHGFTKRGFFYEMDREVKNKKENNASTMHATSYGEKHL